MKTTEKDPGKQKEYEITEIRTPSSGVMTRSQKKRQSLLLIANADESKCTEKSPGNSVRSKTNAKARHSVPKQNLTEGTSTKLSATPGNYLSLTSAKDTRIISSGKNAVGLSRERKNRKNVQSLNTNNAVQNQNEDRVDLFNKIYSQMKSKNVVLSSELLSCRVQSSCSETEHNLNDLEVGNSDITSDNSHIHLNESGLHLLNVSREEYKETAVVNNSADCKQKGTIKSPLSDKKNEITDESENECDDLTSLKKVNKHTHSPENMLRDSDIDTDSDAIDIRSTAEENLKGKEIQKNEKYKEISNDNFERLKESMLTPDERKIVNETKARHLPVRIIRNNQLGFPPNGGKSISESSDSDSDAESRKAIMESAQKRIIQNISTSESESRKFVRPLTKLKKSRETSDSDSAPENISFAAGRKMAMKSLRNAVESIQKEKERRKEKRKQRLEKYKQEKEEKLIRLKEKRASQEDASCSSSEESGYEEDHLMLTFGKTGNKKHIVKQEKENVDDVPQSRVRKLHSSDDDENLKERKERKRIHEQTDIPNNFGELRKLPKDVLENLPDQIPVKVQKLDHETTSKGKKKHDKQSKQDGVKDKKLDFRMQSDVDYIPLNSCGATEFGVMPLDKMMRAPKSMAEQAAEFRHKMLYGSRVKRGPANMHQVYQKKLKITGKDRLVR